MSEAIIKRMQDLPSTHLPGTGTPLCCVCNEADRHVEGVLQAIAYIARQELRSTS